MSDNAKLNPQTNSLPVYPDKTTGSEVAAKIRKGANGWSEQKRAELFERGMQIIYGGPGNKVKASTR